MTALSTLFPAAGGSLPYISGEEYLISVPQSPASTTATADNDFLWRFTPRDDVTVDEIFWRRANATAANVYVGIYDGSGTLLSDCAVDADTTTGLHAVNTTNFSMTKGARYYLCLNQSAQVTVSDTVTPADEETWAMAWNNVQNGLNLDMFSSFPTWPNQAAGAANKSRTNAALLSSLTMTGWTPNSTAAYVGFVPA